MSESKSETTMATSRLHYTLREQIVTHLRNEVLSEQYSEDHKPA